LLLASELGFKLFSQSSLVFLQLDLSFLFKPIFFFTDKFVLLSCVLTQLTLYVRFKFSLELLHIMAQ
jgi:hypothetical protein